MQAHQLTTGQAIQISGHLEIVTHVESADGSTTVITDHDAYNWPDADEVIAPDIIDYHRRLHVIGEIAAALEDALTGDDWHAAHAIQQIAWRTITPDQGLANAWPGQD